MATIADLMVRIGVDDSDLEESFSKIGTKVGALATGIGAAMEGFARSQQEANVAFERMGRVTGEGSDALRDMAASLQSVDFPMSDVVELMETATKRGLRGDAIAEYASFWDMVGDATGEAGPALGKAGVALGLVGIAAGNEAQALDAFGFITDNTTSSIEEFLRFVERTATELGDATPNVDEMAGALGALEEKGLSSQRAQRELRTALSQTDGDMLAALATLGVTQEAYEAQVEAVEGSSDAISANARAYSDSFTPMQKMQAKIENLMTKYGGLADAAGMVSAPLTAVGVGLMGVAKIAPGFVASIGTMVAAIGTKLAALAMWGVHSMIAAVKVAAAWVVAMGPVGWVIAGVIALVALIIANWDTVKKVTKAAWEWVSSKIAAVWEWIKTKTAAAVAAVVRFFGNLKDGAIGKAIELISWISSLPNRLLQALGNLGKILFNAGIQILQGLWNGLKSKWEGVKDWVGGLGSKIANLKGPISADKKLLTRQGEAIMDGLGKGLMAGWADNERLVAGMSSSLFDAFSGRVSTPAMTVGAASGPHEPGVVALNGSGGTAQAAGTVNAFVLTWDDFVMKVREAGVDINRLGWQS